MFHDVAEVVFWAELLADTSRSDKSEVAKRLEVLEDRCDRLIRRCRATLEEMKK